MVCVLLFTGIIFSKDVYPVKFAEQQFGRLLGEAKQLPNLAGDSLEGVSDFTRRGFAHINETFVSDVSQSKEDVKNMFRFAKSAAPDTTGLLRRFQERFWRCDLCEFSRSHLQKRSQSLLAMTQGGIREIGEMREMGGDWFAGLAMPEMPSVDMSIFRNVEMPSFEMPTIVMPSLPEISLPQFTMPTMPAIPAGPKVSLLELLTPELAIPQASLAELLSPEIDIPTFRDFDMPRFVIPDFNITRTVLVISDDAYLQTANIINHLSLISANTTRTVLVVLDNVDEGVQVFADSLTMPSVDISRFRDVEMPKFVMLSLPEISLVELLEPEIVMPQLPDFVMPSLPEISLPQFTMPTMPAIPTGPKVSLLELLTPELAIPEASLAELLEPEIDMPTFGDVDMPRFVMPDFNITRTVLVTSDDAYLQTANFVGHLSLITDYSLLITDYSSSVVESVTNQLSSINNQLSLISANTTRTVLVVLDDAYQGFEIFADNLGLPKIGIPRFGNVGMSGFVTANVSNHLSLINDYSLFIADQLSLATDKLLLVTTEARYTQRMLAQATAVSTGVGHDYFSWVSDKVSETVKMVFDPIKEAGDIVVYKIYSAEKFALDKFGILKQKFEPKEQTTEQAIVQQVSEDVEKEIQELKSQDELLSKEIERLEREGLPAKQIVREIIKEVEVSKITKVEPVKETTKQTIITKIDDTELEAIKIKLAEFDLWGEDIEELRKITKKLQSRPTSVASSSAPIYIASQGLQVGGHGIFDSIGASGAGSFGNLSVGGSTYLGSSANDRLTVIASSIFDSSITINNSLTQTSGQVSFAGNVDASAGLDVTGADFTVGGTNFVVDVATGNVTVGGNLTVVGAQTYSGAADFTATSAVSALSVNQQGAGNVVLFQNNGADAFVIANSGQLTITSDAAPQLTLGYDATNFLTVGCDASSNITFTSLASLYHIYADTGEYQLQRGADVVFAINTNGSIDLTPIAGQIVSLAGPAQISEAALAIASKVAEDLLFRPMFDSRSLTGTRGQVATYTDDTDNIPIFNLVQDTAEMASGGRAYTTITGTDNESLSYSTAGNIDADDGTISLWYSPSYASTATADRYIFHTDDHLKIYYNGTEGKFYCGAYNGTNYITAEATSAAQTFVADDWLHILCAYDNDNGTATVKLYVNNVETTDADTWTAQALPANMFIGSDISANNQSYGKISDFTIFNRVLTRAEVQQIYYLKQPIQDYAHTTTPYANTATVGKYGADYTTISAALTALSGTSDQPALIQVMPGVYQEAITLEDYVDIIAIGGPEVTTIQQATSTIVTAGADNCRIQGFTINKTTDDAAEAISLAAFSPTLENLIITGAGVATQTAIDITSGSPQIENIRISNVNTAITTTTGSPTIINAKIGETTQVATGVKHTGTSGTTTVRYSMISSTTDDIYAFGNGATIVSSNNILQSTTNNFETGTGATIESSFDKYALTDNDGTFNQKEYVRNDSETVLTITQTGTGENLKLAYDTSNYFTVKTDSSGRTILDAVSSDPDAGIILAQDAIYQPQSSYQADQGLVGYWSFNEGQDYPTTTTAYDISTSGNDGTLTGFDGTATAGSTTTLTDATLSDTVGAYVGLELYMTSGNNDGENQTIQSYDESTHIITVDTVFSGGVIANGDTYIVGRADGKYGKGLQFDGHDDYVSVPHHASLDITDAITIEAWVKTTGGDNRILHYRSSDSSHFSFAFYNHIGSNDKYILAVQKTTDSMTVGEYTDTAIVGEWHHLVVTSDGTTVKAYFNGLLQNAGTHPSLSNNGTTDTLFIGRKADTLQNFNGSIDEVRIYDRALLADEVKAHYLRGAETYTDFAISTTATAGEQYANRIVLTDTGVVTTGTDTSYGQKTDVTRTGATDGIIDTYGIHSTVLADNAGSGTSTAVAGYFKATGADTNYSIYAEGQCVTSDTLLPILAQNPENRAVEVKHQHHLRTKQAQELLRSNLNSQIGCVENNQKTLIESRSFSAVGSGVEPPAGKGAEWVLATAPAVGEYLPAAYRNNIVSESKKNNNPFDKVAISDVLSGHVVPTANTQYHYTNSNNLVKTFDVDNIEYVRIDEIKGGEMVLSLNEKTNKIEPARIKALMDMGVKPIYEIVTEDNRIIRTTANHPYLVQTENTEWIKVKHLNPGDKIAVAKLGETSDVEEERSDGSTSDVDESFGSIEFVAIKEINLLPAEQVWDIEVEGTHNFVAGHWIEKVENQKTAENSAIYGRPTDLPIGVFDKLNISISNQNSLSSVSGDNFVKGDVEVGGIEPPRRSLSNTPGKPATPTSDLAYHNNTSDVNFDCHCEERVATSDEAISGNLFFGGIIAHNTYIDIGSASALLIEDSGTKDNVFVVNTTSGNIGIGAAPSYMLDVHASDTTYLTRIYNTSTNAAAAGLYIRTDGDGNLLTLNAGGTDIVTISEAQSTFNNPVSMAAAGDVSVAYDLLMVNATAGNIKFSGPGYIETDSSWQNLDLTLRAANTGKVIVDDTMYISGSVGIGATSPGTLLELASTVPYLTVYNTTEEDTDYGRESEIIFEGEQSGGEHTTLGKIQVAHDGTSNDQKGIMTFKLNDGDDADAPSDVMTLQANGNVGIGTTGPDGVLELNMGTDKQLRLSYNDTDGSAIDYSKFEVGDDGALTITTVDDGAAEGDIILMPDGMVGINIAVPTANLDIKGNLTTALTGTVTVVQNDPGVVGSGTSFRSELRKGDSIKIVAETFNVLSITDDTNLTLSSDYLAAGAGSLTAYKDSNLFYVQNGNSIGAVVVNKSGYLGVGDTSPSSTLTIAASGNLAFGDINDAIIDDMESAEEEEWVESDGTNTNVSTETSIEKVGDGAMKITTDKGSGTITATTIAFVDGGGGSDSFTDTGNGFVAAGFLNGDVIDVTGSTSNDGSYTINAVVEAGTIYVATGSLTAEVAGDTVTIVGHASNTDTIKKSFASPYKDYSSNDRIGFWVRATETGQIFSVKIYDATDATISTHTITIDVVNSWQYEEWNISVIDTTHRDAVEWIEFYIDDDTDSPTIYIDQLRYYDKDNRSGEMFVGADGKLVIAGEQGIQLQANITSSLPALSIDAAIVEINQPFAVNVSGDTGINYDLQFLNTGTTFVTSAGPLVIAAGDPNHFENLTLTTQSNMGGSASGFATATGASTLTDALQTTWAENEWVGGTISILSGTGIGEQRTIASNTTGGQITTTAAWTVTPAIDSYYHMAYARGGDVLVNIANTDLAYGGFKINGMDEGNYIFRVEADGDVHIGGTGIGGSDLTIKQNLTLTGGIITVGQLDPTDAAFDNTDLSENSDQGTGNDQGCDDLEQYYYKITALNDNGETTGSAEATITMSAAAGHDNDDTITIVWDTVEGATKYKIFRSTDQNWGDNDGDDYWVDTDYIFAPTTIYTDDCNYGSTDTVNEEPPTANTTGGKLAINTTSPQARLDVLETTTAAAQMRLTHDGTTYAEFYLDSTGDLNILLTDGSFGDDIRILNENLRICDGSTAFNDVSCPTTGYSISNQGNLIVENKVVADTFERICATGYIWVPGSAKYGTLPGFCVMKYEAKGSSGAVVSTSTGLPYVNISQEDARDECQALSATLGDGYHLMSDPEWMTIAENITYVASNWSGSAVGSGYIFAGHNDNNVTGAKVASSTDTGNNRCAYTDSVGIEAPSPCPTNDAEGESGTVGNQVRVHTLSNGEYIWDIAGNVWEWTDKVIYEDETDGGADGSDAYGCTAEMPDTAESETYVYKSTIAIEDPTAADDSFFEELADNVTFTSIYCKTLVGTATLNVQIAGSDINDGNIVCTIDGVLDESLVADISGAVGEELKLEIASVSAAPAPTYLMVQVNGISVSGETAQDWQEYISIVDFKGLDIVPPNSDTGVGDYNAWNSADGIGKIYINPGHAYDGNYSSAYHAFLRGGYWGDTSVAGVFSLNLNNSPARTAATVGFRCAR